MPDAVTPTANPAKLEKRIGQYVQLRDKITEIKKRHEAELAPLNDALVLLNAALLEHLNINGGDSVNVRGVGTVYKTLKTSATIADGQSFRDFVVGNAAWEMIDWRANARAVTDYIAANDGVPPGINYRQVAVVGVRRPTE